MPWMSRLFGLKPWDIDDLTGDEIDAYLEHLSEYLEPED